jgi:hypothetical protein
MKEKLGVNRAGSGITSVTLGRKVAIYYIINIHKNLESLSLNFTGLQIITSSF